MKCVYGEVVPERLMPPPSRMFQSQIDGKGLSRSRGKGELALGSCHSSPNGEALAPQPKVEGDKGSLKINLAHGENPERIKPSFPMPVLLVPRGWT